MTIKTGSDTPMAELAKKLNFDTRGQKGSPSLIVHTIVPVFILFTIIIITLISVIRSLKIIIT